MTEERGTIVLSGIQPNAQKGTITFVVGGYNDIPQMKIIELNENGDIFVKGKLIENDKELVQGLREFFMYWKQRNEKVIIK